MRYKVAGFGLLTAVLLSVSTTKAFADDLDWSKRFGGSASDIVHDINGSVFAIGGYVMTGAFADTVSFGGSPLASAGGTDVYLLKIDDSGSHEWSVRLGGAGNDVGYACFGSLGGILVVGSFEETANFGGDDLTSVGGRDIFIAKYTYNGAHVWSQSFGGPLDDECLDVDCYFDIYITGYFRDDINLGGSTLSSAGGSDIFVAKYDNNGVHLWSARYGGVLDDSGNSLKSGSQGIWVGGEFSGTANLGGSNLVSAGGKDGFYTRFNSAGIHQSSARFGSAGNDRVTAVAGLSDVYITGNFTGTVNLGGSNLTSAGGSDIVLAAYDASGVHKWSKRLGGPQDDVGRGVAQGGQQVVVTGEFRGTANLGGGPRVSVGGSDVFFAKFEQNTGFHWASQRYGSLQDDVGSAILLDQSGIPEAAHEPLMTGSFRGAVDFGEGPLNSAGEADIFVLKFRGWPSPTGAGDTPRAGSIAVSSAPNPFNPRTAIVFTVAENAPVTVAVFDGSGAHVATLVNQEQLPAGTHRVEWDGRSKLGAPAASGVYFARVEQLGASGVSKMVLLK